MAVGVWCASVEPAFGWFSAYAQTLSELSQAPFGEEFASAVAPLFPYIEQLRRDFIKAVDIEYLSAFSSD